MQTETDGVELVGDQTVENIARAAVFAALTGAMAYVSFQNPVSPAPVTLQVLGSSSRDSTSGPSGAARPWCCT